jgi:hypothetical protein
MKLPIMKCSLASSYFIPLGHTLSSAPFLKHPQSMLICFTLHNNPYLYEDLTLVGSSVFFCLEGENECQALLIPAFIYIL